MCLIIFCFCMSVCLPDSHILPLPHHVLFQNRCWTARSDWPRPPSAWARTRRKSLGSPWVAIPIDGVVEVEVEEGRRASGGTGGTVVGVVAVAGGRSGSRR